MYFFQTEPLSSSVTQIPRRESFLLGRSSVLDPGMLSGTNWHSFLYKKINNFCFKFNEDKVNAKA